MMGVALVAGALFVGSLVDGDGGAAPPKRAAIVDQLSETGPPPVFAERATNILERAGYAVEYFPQQVATVEFYRYLQTRGYGVIIFRAHSSRLVGEWNGKPMGEALIWTSEPFDPGRYVEERRQLRLTRVYAYEGTPWYFGIGAGFVRSSMRGDFNGTTIIMMGCDGLNGDVTARAFLDRGARAVISWDGDVGVGHTDAATERLLRKLFAEGLPVDQAVEGTNAELGPDPVFGAELRALYRGAVLARP